MKKRKIVILITTAAALILLSVFTVFSAFIFQRATNGIGKSGNFEITEQKFLVYDAANRTADPTEYDINETVSDTTNGIDISNGVIKSYASQKKGYSDDKPYVQLNQLGFKIGLSTTINLYLRIRIQDSWISYKIFKNGTTTETNILKGTAIADALTGNADWVYDSVSGYIYYTKMIESGDDLAVSFSFPSTYYYEVGTASYRESVIVDFSYKIDAVQANRANAIWGVDIDDYIS